MLALNLVLFITYSIFMILGNRPFYSWLILLVLGANIVTHSVILRTR